MVSDIDYPFPAWKPPYYKSRARSLQNELLMVQLTGNNRKVFHTLEILLLIGAVRSQINGNNKTGGNAEIRVTDLFAERHNPWC